MDEPNKEVEKALKTDEMDKLIKEKTTQTKQKKKTKKAATVFRVSIREQIAKLLGRREVVLYGMTGGLLYGLVTRILDPKDFMVIGSMVFGFYFAQRGVVNAVNAEKKR